MRKAQDRPVTGSGYRWLPKGHNALPTNTGDSPAIEGSGTLLPFSANLSAFT